ncbi:DUF4215 domain-containing protein [Patescibacteria group bacterium]|nr:DUF4215 domain-containing protein [Patescibacteria group bacterium]MBU2259053.1 DUF4215 domain-containing protein [Patescibacteria group bacterium]
MKIKTTIGLALIACAIATGGVLVYKDGAGGIVAQSGGGSGVISCMSRGGNWASRRYYCPMGYNIVLYGGGCRCMSGSGGGGMPPDPYWLVYQKQCRDTGGSLETNMSCHDLCRPTVSCFTSASPVCDCGSGKCWDSVTGGCIPGKGGQEAIQAASSGNLDVTCLIDKEIEPGESFEVDLMASTNTRYSGPDAELQVTLEQATSGLLSLLEKPVRSTHYQGVPPTPPAIYSPGALIHDDRDSRFLAPDDWMRVAQGGYKDNWVSPHSQGTGKDSLEPAVWSFGEIMPGEYAVYATWPGGGVSSSTFSFSEEGQAPVTIIEDLNQGIAPEEGRNQFGPVYWMHIGYMDVLSGRDVKVQLTGIMTKADGVILVPSFSPPHTLGFNCGDGEVQSSTGEYCDDGNRVDGDGCSSICKKTSQCDDKVDNDQDGQVDCADAGCHGDLDASNADSCNAQLNDESRQSVGHVLDNGDDTFIASEAGEAQQKYWKQKVNGYRGTQHVYDAPKFGGMQPGAGWRVSGLNPGFYDVYSIWRAPITGAKARYNISQQGRYTERLDVNVDQGKPIYSQDGDEWDGVRWKHLGTFEVVDGDVSVSIQSATAYSSGRDIFIADAVRFVSVDLRPPDPVCGNGSKEEGEQCDDGNQSNRDACLNSCDNAGCGDGIVWEDTEECDDGNQINTDTCLNTCNEATCSDGFVQENVEGCDDGNRVDGDGCTSQCQIEQGEECPLSLCSTVTCDGGNVCYEHKESGITACANPGIAASGWTECGGEVEEIVCGDGLIMGVEECDDGNQLNTDACLNTCNGAICGDGFVQENVEGCDDGNTFDGDGCSSQCKIELVECALCSTVTCGGGKICYENKETGVTACANPGIVSSGWTECGGEVEEVVCGDGYVDASEGCDDGNTLAGDGCSGTCTIEQGWQCTDTCGEISANTEEQSSSTFIRFFRSLFANLLTFLTADTISTDSPQCPSTCTPICGDGLTKGNEECDDGNDSSDDECLPTCLINYEEDFCNNISPALWKKAHGYQSIADPIGSSVKLAVHDQKLWRMGDPYAKPGAYGKHVSKIHYFDGASWKYSVGTLPADEELTQYATTSFGGKLWVIGGREGSTHRKYVYTTIDGETWNQEFDLPYKISFPSAFVHKGSLWVAGNVSNMNTPGGLSVFRLTGAMFQHVGSDSTIESWDYGKTFSWKGEIWHIEDNPYYSPGFRKIYASGDGVSWREVGALPVSLKKFIPLAVCDKLYIVGGVTSQNQRSVSVFSTTDGVQWTKENSGDLLKTFSPEASAIYFEDIWLGGTETGPGIEIGLCGDGNKEGSEQCDDGNQNNDDGCSTQCQIE